MRVRVRDYALLIAVCAFLTLPNLGAPSLWDQDEGLNAQASREMKEAETWVIPTFNYQLRTAKPVMINWLQRISYEAFGVSEWSARLPSVLAGWLTVLLVYELARRMFDRLTGLLAGLILATVANFDMIARAATPDATLLGFTVLSFLLFWVGHLNGSRRWWYPMAMATGLAFLTKGPIALALPALVVLFYFAWNCELKRLFDRKLPLAIFLFLLVAGPWYGLVSSETRGEWLTAFFKNENMNRFLTPMDRHSGMFVYYLLIIPVMYAPWCVFLYPTFVYGLKGTRCPGNSLMAALATRFRQAVSKIAGVRGLAFNARRVVSRHSSSDVVADSSLIPHPSSLPTESLIPFPGELTNQIRAYRFLICWIAAYVIFFSAAATKLPHYILPIYPAMAILTARFLVGWRTGQIAVPRWLMPGTVATTVLVGVIYTACVAMGDWFFPGVGVWAAMGAIPLLGAVWMWFCLRKDYRGGLVLAVTVTSIAFMGLMVSFPPTAIEPYKGIKELVRVSGVDDRTRDLRVGQFEGLPPSLVFYAGREVQELLTVEKVAEFLAVPTPAYLFVQESTWYITVAHKVTVPVRVVGRHYDLLREGYVVVVTNEIGGEQTKK